MEDNVVEFPPQETNTTEVKTPEKGVTTINQLRKKVKEIDIYSIPRDPDVDTGEGYKWSCFSKNEETGEFTLNEDSFTPYFNKKTDKMEYRLSLMKERVSRYGNDDFPDGLNRHHNDRIKFTGKTQSFYGASNHTNYSECSVYTDSLRGNIAYVEYSLDKSKNRFFKNFLRSTIDPSIPNNWDEVHKTKTFEFTVVTRTYEKISAEGRNIEEARANAQKSDKTLEWMSGRFNGMKEILDKYDSRHIDFRTREEILADKKSEDA